MEYLEIKQELINNFNKLHTTELGKIRIEKNLNIEEDVIYYSKKIIINENSKIIIKGKNYYCYFSDIVITINKYSFTIITAHKIDKCS